jgi:hypothetical protein
MSKADIQELVIDGKTYVPKSDIPELKGDVKIVVFQRGWVAVGILDKTNSEEFLLTNASVIRSWGTTKGLGEIAIGGPTAKTVLDKTGTIRFNPGTIVLVMDTEESKWLRSL